MIRQLSSNEAGLCVEGGRLFFDEGKLPGGFKAEVFERRWREIIDEDRGIILGMFEGGQIQGALGAVLYPDLNNGDLIAVEAFWYMIPKFRGNGLRLLLAFEAWARERGAKRTAMIHLMNLQPEKLKRVYEHFGYRAIEINYVKTL